MVGLTQYGEAAWSFEQLYNAWLATQEPANGDLLGVSHEVLTSFLCLDRCDRRRSGCVLAP